MPQSIPPNKDRLFQLLPSLYQQADAANGGQLQALLGLVGNHVESVRGDIQQLWNNYFIETCAPWAVPYIGDLVANRTLHDIDQAQDEATAKELFTDLTGPNLRPVSAIRTRADVAKTIYYRRRKGTVPMLEELAGDVTGWGAHVVELFQLLTWPQNLNHFRLQSTGCVDLRSVSACSRVNGPFDSASHNVDVRGISQSEGWYNVPNLGFFLWRLLSIPSIMVRACLMPPTNNIAWRYTFSPLGNSAPLFVRWPRAVRQAGMDPRLFVPEPIPSPAFFDDLVALNSSPNPASSNYYGEVSEGASASLYVVERFAGTRAAIQVGTNILSITDPNFSFTPNDVGFTIEVPSAGKNGAVLTTTVASYTNPKQVNLSDSSAATIANDTFKLYRPVAGPDTTIEKVAGTGASINAGSNVLSTTANFFTPNDVGLKIELFAPGANGPTFTTTVTGYVDPQHVNLNDSSAASILGGSFNLYRPAITCMNLDNWNRTNPPFPQPPGTGIGIDVERGRLAVCAGRYANGTPPDALYVSYNYGFSANLGGGPYPDRQKWIVPDSAADQVIKVDATISLDDALTTWQNNSSANTIINIADNDTHLIVKNTQWTLDPEKWLVIQAVAGQLGSRPHIRPNGGVITLTGASSQAGITLGGLLIEGGINVTQDIQKLRLLHTTLVPGGSINEEPSPPNPAKQISLTIQGLDANKKPINTTTQIQIAFSITGALQIPATVDSLWLLDSIVDGTAFQTAISDNILPANFNPAPNTPNGPLATIERSTILGRSFFRKFDFCSDTIFTDIVTVEDCVAGCLRFSFVPIGSATPQQYRCQPRLEIDTQFVNQSGTVLTYDQVTTAVQSWLVPGFNTTVYGQPAYCQLSLASPSQIRTGGSDGAEMGAFNHLRQPQRETNLLIRLREYVPFGRAPGIIYVT